MAENNQPVELSINDLRLCQQIISLCSERGAFQPAEFMSVGQLYSKLTAFLAASDAMQQQAEDPAEQQQQKKEVTND